MTPPPLQPIAAGQIWQRKGTDRQVRVISHDLDWGVVALEPIGRGRSRHCMEISLWRNYELIEDVEK